MIKYKIEYAYEILDIPAGNPKGNKRKLPVIIITTIVKNKMYGVTMKFDSIQALKKGEKNAIREGKMYLRKKIFRKKFNPSKRNSK